MSESIQIRLVEPRDFAHWKLLWDSYNAFYGRQGTTALPEAVTTTTWSRFLDTSEPMSSLVADHSGQLVGLANFLFHRSTTSPKPTCYLQDLFTREDARGKGVGRALIEEVYRNARNAGASEVYWQTHETNATARRLYAKLAENSGFLVYSRFL